MRYADNIIIGIFIAIIISIVGFRIIQWEFWLLTITMNLLYLLGKIKGE